MPSDDVEIFGVHAATSRTFLQLLAQQLADRRIDLAVTGPMAWRSHGIYDTPPQNDWRHYHLQMSTERQRSGDSSVVDASVVGAIEAAVLTATSQASAETNQDSPNAERGDLPALERLLNSPENARGQRVLLTVFGDFFHIVGPRDEWYVPDLFRRSDLSDGSPPCIPRSVAEQQVQANRDSDAIYRQLRQRKSWRAKRADAVDEALWELGRIASGCEPTDVTAARLAATLAVVLEGSGRPEASEAAAALAASLCRPTCPPPHGQQSQRM